MSQTWRDLLFMHWPVPRELLEAMIPDGLEVHTFQKKGWIGIVPFRCTGMRPPFLPSLLGLLNFPAVSVRVCVTCDGKPGVYYLSLDATHRLAHWLASRVVRLPFFFAPIRRRERGGFHEWSSRRTQKWAPTASLNLNFRPQGELYAPEPKTLEHWIFDRHCVYTLNRRWQLMRSPMRQRVGLVQGADVDMTINTMAQGHGLPLPDEAPHVMFVKKMKVNVWRAHRVGARR